jgi:hypothetical protein
MSSKVSCGKRKVHSTFIHIQWYTLLENFPITYVVSSCPISWPIGTLTAGHLMLFSGINELWGRRDPCWHRQYGALVCLNKKKCLEYPGTPAKECL